jgi:hypothetical protein
MVFEGIIGAIAVSGMFPVYLAFLLVFAIIFGILANTKILGAKPQIDAVVAFIIGLYLVAFSPMAVPISQWFVTIFSAASVVIVSLLVFILVIAMLLSPFWTQISGKDMTGIWGLLAVLGIVIGGLIVFGSSFGFGGTIPTVSSQDIVFILFVVITLLLVYFIIGGGGGKKPGARATLPLDLEK